MTSATAAAAAQAAATTDDEDEVMIVPTHLAEFPLGFVLDAGGSVTKLIYRSKKDYNNGRSREADSTEGKLRLRYFSLGTNEKILGFLQEHCDIMESSRFRPEEGEPVWFQTGVHTQHFKETMEKTLNIKTKIAYEMQALTTGLMLHLSTPQLKASPPTIKGVERALKTVRIYITYMAKNKDFEEDVSRKALEKGTIDPEFLQRHAMKMMTIDAPSYAAELGKEEIKLPCLLVVCGSAFVLLLIEEDGSSTPFFHNQMSGKTFIGLGRVLTGAKNFEELIAMASRGDVSKVNLTNGDLKAEEHQEEDVYSSAPDDHMLFALGKLVPKAEEAPYSKDDLAAGLLHIHCLNMAKYALVNAMLKKTKSVVFCGSFVEPVVAREAIEEYFLTDAILEGFMGKEPVSLHFLTHPGFLCALGVWSKNLELGSTV